MCGIFVCHRHPDALGFKLEAERLSKTLAHRGPDDSGTFLEGSTILCHERLAIVGSSKARQPIVREDVALVASARIYNHETVRKSLAQEEFNDSQTDSDSEAIIHAYRRHGRQAPQFLDGIFSFALYDRTQDRLVVARDPLGVTSLYQGWNSHNGDTLFFASEMKALHPICDYIMAFPPGHVLDTHGSPYYRYDSPAWQLPECMPSSAVNHALIRDSLTMAVRKRMMSDMPYGVLLSGSFDSSLIAAIVAREMDSCRKLSDPKALRTDIPAKVSTFSVGLQGSADASVATKVAKFLGTDHHAYHFTFEEGIEALSDVIYYTETFDVASVRASAPLFLLSTRMKAEGYKVLLSAEGSKEIFGGYANVPSMSAMQQERVRRIKQLHHFDIQQAHKATMASGVEARFPFLDKEVVEVAMSIDPREKQISPSRLDKQVLRKAFDDATDPYLPHDILWGQGEYASSGGTGYGWIALLKAFASACVTPKMMDFQPEHWAEDPPITKEAYLYRRLFDQHFPPQCAATVEKRESNRTVGTARNRKISKYLLEV